MTARRIILSCLAVIALGSAAFMGAVSGGAAVYWVARDRMQPAPTQIVEVPVVAPVEDTTSIVDTSTAVQEAVANVSPAVVTVVTDLGSDSFSSGSGVIISADGYLVTNNHVVEGYRGLSVVFQDGTEAEAELVGTDAFADIAVLKVEAPVPAYAPFGNSDALNPGETVIAIGSPLGDFRNTVTVGVVSATGRALDTMENFQMEGLIQTDAAINNGNSGGPLVNLAGEVVGINTLVVRGGSSSGQAEGLGFAIASNIVQAVSDQLIAQGFVARPYLGIGWESITPPVARANDLPVDWGVYISSVEPGSPAAVAGLQPRDILVQVGDVALDEEHPFINTLWTHEVGETVAVTVVRGDERVTVEVVLGERPG